MHEKVDIAHTGTIPVEWKSYFQCNNCYFNCEYNNAHYGIIGNHTD